MKTLIVYESMYGNTHAIATAIAEGCGLADIQVVPTAEASAELVDWADLVIVGGPTHVHGMSSSSTRKGARTEAAKPEKGLDLDPDSEGPGLRDWFNGLPEDAGKSSAAFDTRLDGSTLLTGRASRGITHRLRKHGFNVVVDPESFLVDKHNTLLPGETDRAKSWGEQLARKLVS